MKQVAEAIMARYESPQGAALKAKTPGGMWHTVAPQGASDADRDAYVVFGFIAIGHEETFTSEMEEPLVQFTIVSFTRDAVEVQEIFDELKACFDQCELTTAGFDFIEMRRQSGANLVRDPEDDAWLYMVDYGLKLQKQ